MAADHPSEKPDCTQPDLDPERTYSRLHDYRNTRLAQRMRRFRRLTMFVVSIISSFSGGAIFAFLAGTLIAFLPAMPERRYIAIIEPLSVLFIWLILARRSRQRRKIAYRGDPATTAAFFLGYGGAALFFAFTIWR